MTQHRRPSLLRSGADAGTPNLPDHLELTMNQPDRPVRPIDEFHDQMMAKAEAERQKRAAASAVVSPPTDRAAVLLDAAAECNKAGGAYAERGADSAAGAAFALMETFLRKAGEAEFAATPCSAPNVCMDGDDPCDAHERILGHIEGDHDLCAPDCGQEWLRRLAVEAQSCRWEHPHPGYQCEPRTVVEAHDTGTQQQEAHPAEHSWAAELYDPAADEWVPGSRYAVRDRAVAALEHGRRIGPTWKDGTPTRRRLVRATTTYTVEEAAPVAQQPVAEVPGATLPAWLHQRFGTRGRYGQSWDALGDDDRAYWEHEAAAVRRAVARGGFKAAPAEQQAAAADGEETRPPCIPDHSVPVHCPGCAAP